VEELVATSAKRYPQLKGQVKKKGLRSARSRSAWYWGAWRSWGRRRRGRNLCRLR